MMTALQTCLMAARAAGIACVDGVYNAFKDEDGLRAECEQGRDLGMDGKTLIHPAADRHRERGLRAVVRRPSTWPAVRSPPSTRPWRQGEAVAVVDGKIVENLHVATARATLARPRPSPHWRPHDPSDPRYPALVGRPFFKRVAARRCATASVGERQGRVGGGDPCCPWC